MMAVNSPPITPWMTSDDLIAAVQRKIALPLSQNTFSPEDVLAFANEEMFIAQVPSVLQFHEEYFVDTVAVPLVQGQNTYPIPNRAIGMRLRSLYWQDDNGNLFDMTRINEDDRAFFQRNVGANQAIHKFFFQGNNVVLTPSLNVQPTGSLFFAYFLRPNQLVTNDRAAIATGFSQSITIDITTMIDGDNIQIMNNLVTIPQSPVLVPVEATDNVVPVATFTATTGSPLAFQFLIGPDSITTANNLVSAINSSGLNMVASNGTPSTNIVNITFPTPGYSYIVSNIAAFNVSLVQGVACQSVPANITNGSTIDFLQTKPGHRTYAYDVQIPLNGINGNTINFPVGEIPQGMIIGDYICLANECIIPQIPTDLHNGLAERTCARILAAQGDQQGLQTSMSKIQEIEKTQGNLLDNRGEGDNKKVNPRYSLLRFTKMGVRRRF